jgi:hypothetical protein
MCTASCIRRWTLRALPLVGVACASAAVPPSEYELLNCGPQTESVAVAVADTTGDSLSVRGHILALPRGSLRHNQRFRLEDRRDGYVGVEISPDRFEFVNPAQLTLSYARCEPLPSDPSRLRIYHVDGTRVIEEIESQVDTAARTVTADIQHLSGYLIGGT